MTQKLPYCAHAETYRGIAFQINETALGRIGMLCGNHPEFGHFARYCDEEARKRPTPESMRASIDRALARAPLYTGDMRDLT